MNDKQHKSWIHKYLKSVTTKEFNLLPPSPTLKWAILHKLQLLSTKEYRLWKPVWYSFEMIFLETQSANIGGRIPEKRFDTVQKINSSVIKRKPFLWIKWWWLWCTTQGQYPVLNNLLEYVNIHRWFLIEFYKILELYYFES